MNVKAFDGVHNTVVMACSSALFPEARRRGETFCFAKFASLFLFPLVCLLLGLAPEAGAETPVVSFSSRYSSGTEGDSSKDIRINISPPPTSDITIYYEMQNRGDATPYFDFSLLHPGADGSIYVTSGSNDATIYVLIEDDSEYEIHEELWLKLREGDGYKVGKPSTHRFVIFDDDDPPPTPPEIGIASGNAVTEGSGVTFILYSVPAPAKKISVNVKVSENGAFAASGETGQRKVLVGMGGRGEFTVKTDNDNVDEPDGSITATVIAGNGYSPDKNSYSVSVGVKDNDDSTPSEDENGEEDEKKGDEKEIDNNEESSDREELLEIYRATEGPTWTESDNWDTDKPISEWHGVSVDENSMVAGLYLDSNGLSGEFPVSELSTMTELRELALWDNEGLAKVPDNEKVDRAVLRTLYEDNGNSEIRSWFPEDEKTDYFSYSNWDGVTVNESGRITGLDLSGNSDLTGELPLGLMDLSELTHLDISGTMLCPPENKAFEEWLGKLAVFTGNAICDGVKGSGAGCAISSVSSGSDQWKGVSFALAVFALTAVVLLGSGCGGTARRGLCEADS